MPAQALQLFFYAGVAPDIHSDWCRRRDSNSHGFRHRPLKTACLPIPPRRQTNPPCAGVRSRQRRTLIATASRISLFWYLLHPAAIRRNWCRGGLFRGRYGLTRRLSWNAPGQRLRRSALLRYRRSAHHTFFIRFARQHVGESHARQEKYDSKNRSCATQKVCRAGGAEHTAGRASAKRSADISAFPVLQQHESDDAERGHHMKNQNQNFHSSTIKPRRWPRRRSS